MPPGFLALIAAIIGTITGLSSQEQVEQMSDEERARLDEQFGGIDNFIREVDLVQESGLPDLNFQGITESLGLSTPGELAIGSAAQFTDPSGEEFFGDIRRGREGAEFTFDPQFGRSDSIRLNEGFQPFAKTGTGPGELSGIDISSDEASGRIFNFLRENIPDPGSVGEGVDFDNLGLDFNEVFNRINTNLDRGDLQSDLQGQFDAATGILGNLRTDFEFTDFLPSGLTDPSAFRNAELERLTNAEQANRQSESLRASRGLQEAGILPGSAAFGFETGLGPQIRSEERFGQGQLNIEEAVQNIIGTNAQFEASARSQAAQVNASNVLGAAGILTSLTGIGQQIQAVQEQTIGNQNIVISGAMTESGRQALEAAGIQINANHLDVQNEFAQFGAQFNITQAQLNQYNSLLTLGAGLTQAQMGFVTQLLMSKLGAEIQESGSTVLDSDIFNQALGSAGQAIQFFESMPGAKEGGTQASIFGTGGGTTGCIAGFGILLTPGGPKTLREVGIGDEVLAADGSFREVIAKEYGPAPEEGRERHFILVTEFGNTVVGTENHCIAGRKMKNWGPGMKLRILDIASGELQPAKIVYHEEVPYIESGDLILEGNADYLVNHISVASVAGAKMDAIMAQKIGAT